MAASREPASIRYKNPGAMWGNALAVKWGASPRAVRLNDGKGQGNNIAVFPTFVQGICAQLDLWRTSKNYRNKPFAEAIAIWSGHNEVKSYIDFVLKRVPGMTRDTIMNDGFWQSPMGIAFLKAQAWHEAGKRYPAPDADWSTAQRHVFEASPAKGSKAAAAIADAPEAPIDPGPPPHTINVQPPSATYRTKIETAQRCLAKLGYHEVGEIDGLMGGKTKGAIAAFLNDRGLKDVGGMAGVEEELSKSVAEGWSRPISTARAMATAKDIAPKVEAVRQSLWQRLAAKVTGTGAAAGTIVMGAASQFGAVNEQISPIKEFFSNVPGWAWFALAAIAAVLLYISSNRAAEATTSDYNTGKLN